MRLRRVSIALVAAVVLSACGGSQWTEFTSSGGRFTILAPGSFEEDSQSVPTAAGDIELHLFTLDRGSEGYFVGYFDMPPELLAFSDANALLDGAIQGAFGNVGGNVDSQQFISLDGFPGIEAAGSFTFSGQRGSMKARAYVVGERVFQVYVASRGSVSELEEVDRFLDSFRPTSQ